MKALYIQYPASETNYSVLLKPPLDLLPLETQEITTVLGLSLHLLGFLHWFSAHLLQVVLGLSENPTSFN